MVEKQRIYKNLILNYDKIFAKNNYHGKLFCGKSYIYLKGKIPVLISAPHSVKQTRNGKTKIWDGYTGAMGNLLKRITNCHLIYKSFNDNTDANYYEEDSGYKEKILKVIEKNDIKVLIDLHAAADFREFDIDIATDYGKNLNGKKEMLEKLLEILEKNNIKNVTNNSVFTASNPNTVAKYVSLRTNIPCMELEIHKDYRIVDRMDNMENIVEALKQFIEMFEDKK